MNSRTTHRRSRAAPDSQAPVVGHSQRRHPTTGRRQLHRSDVQRFLTFLTGRHVKLDLLTLVQALVAVALNIGKVYEDVVTLLSRDESESLFRIEKLHCAVCHEDSIL